MFSNIPAEKLSWKIKEKAFLLRCGIQKSKDVGSTFDMEEMRCGRGFEGFPKSDLGYFLCNLGRNNLPC